MSIEVLRVPIKRDKTIIFVLQIRDKTVQILWAKDERELTIKLLMDPD